MKHMLLKVFCWWCFEEKRAYLGISLMALPLLMVWMDAEVIAFLFNVYSRNSSADVWCFCISLCFGENEEEKPLLMLPQWRFMLCLWWFNGKSQREERIKLMEEKGPTEKKASRIKREKKRPHMGRNFKRSFQIPFRSFQILSDSFQTPFRLLSDASRSSLRLHTRPFAWDIPLHP